MGTHQNITCQKHSLDTAHTLQSSSPRLRTSMSTRPSSTTGLLLLAPSSAAAHLTPSRSVFTCTPATSKCSPTTPPTLLAASAVARPASSITQSPGTTTSLLSVPAHSFAADTFQCPVPHAVEPPSSS